VGKKLTYDDVLAEAVYSVLETLRVKHQEKIIEKMGTSDVLVMGNEQRGEMVELITQDRSVYMQMVKLTFDELRDKYLKEDMYDSSGETLKKVPYIKDEDIEINFGY
jgi:hypothetical protein